MYIRTKVGMQNMYLLEVDMRAKFGRNPSNGVEVIEKNLKKIWENLDYHPPPIFRPPTSKRVNRFLRKS